MSSGVEPGKPVQEQISGLKIFVVGNSRSGTTMMGRILGNHPEVFTFHEIHFFEQLWACAEKHKVISMTDAVQLLCRLFSIQRKGYFADMRACEFVEEAGEVVGKMGCDHLTSEKVYGEFLSYETLRNGKKFPCEQTPRNVFYIAEILDLFPDARFINMVRDPRDVLLSQKWKWKRRFLGAKNIPWREALRSWINYHPITISKLWNASVTAAAGFAGDGRVLTARFEDLLQDPERETRRICEFVGISFYGSLLAVPQVGSSSGTDNAGRKGISRDKSGNWKRGGLNPSEIGISQKVTADLMDKYHYELVSAGANPARLAFYLLSFPMKMLLAFFLNLGRTKNLREAIRRRMGGGCPAKQSP